MAYESEWVRLVRTLKNKEIDPETGKPFQLRELTLRGKKYIINEKQSEFISDLDGDNHKYVLLSGGRGAGKSLAVCVKLYMMCKGFKGITILLGRKTVSDLIRTTLNDFFRIVPPSEYEYKVKDGLINFKNGSQIVLLGLDDMKSGDVGDINKARQKTKSMNFGSYFIDQLEEIEFEVFKDLSAAMRQTSPDPTLDYPRQGNATCNPANFWAYHFFKLGENQNEDGVWIPKREKDAYLIEVSMLDNQANLPKDFVKDQLNREESYVRRMVHGEWSTDVLIKGSVFAKEHIRRLETFRKPPIRIVEGCEIYEEPKPGVTYQMGVDPSEGVVDPSSISVVSSDGKKVAKFNGMVPVLALADKVKFLYYMYQKPRIIPEANSSPGAALIREIRDLKVYRRKQLDYKTDKETEKLGFKTSWDSKSQLIAHFQELLRSDVPKIYDPKTIEEMKVFLWNDDATQQGAGAARGFHDDEVMSTMLAYWEFHPKKVEEILINRAIPKKTVKRFQYQ